MKGKPFTPWGHPRGSSPLRRNIHLGEDFERDKFGPRCTPRRRGPHSLGADFDQLGSRPRWEAGRPSKKPEEVLVASVAEAPIAVAHARRPINWPTSRLQDQRLPLDGL